MQTAGLLYQAPPFTLLLLLRLPAGGCRPGKTAPAPTSTTSPDLPNGSGAAAILAAGIGSMMVAIFAIAADKSAAIKSMMIFYKPTGPLSGVTTSAILVWLISWAILDLLWRKRSVSLGRI